MAKNSKSKYKIGSSVYETAEEERGTDNSYINAIDFSSLGSRKPDKDSFFKPKDKKTYSMNIIPFIMKSENNPFIHKGKAEIGQAHYMLDVFIHSGVGPDGGSVVCLKNNYGKACPVCDLYQEMADAAETKNEKQAASRIKAKRRAYMNVQMIEDGEPSDELLIWNAGHFRFMKEGILDEANACREGGEAVPFADPEDGSIIKFRTSHSDLSDKDITIKKVDFVDRDEEIDEDVLEQALSFDEFMVVHTAEELKAILDGDDIDAKPSKKKASKVEDEDDEEDEEDVEEEEEEEEAPKPTKKVAKKKKEVVEEEEAEEADEADEAEEDVEEEEVKPKKTVKKAAKKVAKKVVKKAVEEAEDEEDTGPKCEYGMEFGSDYEADKDKCDQCFDENGKCWKACMKRHSALEAEED